MQKNAPIGIFDSGVGGLTLAQALHKHLPNEDLIYFGDTAHTPWGDKSSQAIQTYAKRITDFLVSQNCKLILIACHSASAAAYSYLKTHVHNKVPIVNVIDPVIDHLKTHSRNKKIGLIGTKQTIFSNAYQNKLREIQCNLEICALPTPLLCPLVEENLPQDHPLISSIIAHYLSHPILQDIQSLILGCTHYGLLKSTIEQYYHHNIDMIDSETILAQTIKETLIKNNLLNDTIGAHKTFYISDLNNFFCDIANRFFQEKILLQQISF